MARHRRRVWLVVVVGLAFWLPACATARDRRAAPALRAAPFATTQFDPYWWRERAGIDAVNDGGLTGRGSRVAIVDTGVLFEHEDLKRADLKDGVELCSGQNRKAEDRSNGHGTELAGIVVGPRNGLATRGVASDATLFPYKVVCGTAKAGVVAEGVRRALTENPHVILLALGPWPGDTDAGGQSLDELLKGIVDQNPAPLFVVASVWDLGQRPDWTRSANVLLVAAMTLDQEMKVEVPFNTKRGDLWAPGRDVATSSIDPRADASPHERYLMQGTSAASAVVAGCAAALQQTRPPGVRDGAALKQQVLRAVVDVGLPDGSRLQCDKGR
jgi:minor extracellular serine protease Vpr